MKNLSLRAFGFSGLFVVRLGLGLALGLGLLPLFLGLPAPMAAAASLPPGSPAVELNCSNLLSGGGLTERQAAVLAAAEAQDYEVVVMSGEVAGVQRTVALLGEFHLKNKAAKTAGQAVVQEFPLRGTEGLSIKTVWGGKAFEWAVRFSYRLYQAAFLFTRNETSTVNDVYRSAALNAEAQRLQNRLRAGQIREGDLPTLMVDIDGQKMSAAEVFRELGLAPGSEAGTEIPQFINVKLEQNHRPDLYEHLQTVLIPVHFSACAAATCGWMAGVFVPDNLFTSSSSTLAWATTVFVFGQIYSARLLKRWWKGHPVYEQAFALNHGLINGRNSTMARNILWAFEQHPDQHHMLVVVGKAHLEGMRDILHDHGFRYLLPFADAQQQK